MSKRRSGVDATRPTDTERALRESEERYRTLVESISDVVYAIDGGGVLTYISPVVKNTFGYEPEELIGRHLLEIVDKEDHELLMRRFSELREGDLRHSDYRVIGKQGDIKWVRTLLNPIMGEEGFVGARGVLVDISERKRAEEARAYLASIVESADDTIIGKSMEGVIQSWNAGAERLYGYAASEVIGQSILLLIPPERHEEAADFLRRIKRGERIDHHETVRVTKGGRLIHVSVTISPLKNPSGEVIGASTTARDITERKAGGGGKRH
jgi:two-component system CheB/CheR fusion protein